LASSWGIGREPREIDPRLILKGEWSAYVLHSLRIGHVRDLGFTISSLAELSTPLICLLLGTYASVISDMLLLKLRFAAYVRK